MTEKMARERDGKLQVLDKAEVKVRFCSYGFTPVDKLLPVAQALNCNFINSSGLLLHVDEESSTPRERCGKILVLVLPRHPYSYSDFPLVLSFLQHVSLFPCLLTRASCDQPPLCPSARRAVWRRRLGDNYCASATRLPEIPLLKLGDAFCNASLTHLFRYLY